MLIGDDATTDTPQPRTCKCQEQFLSALLHPYKIVIPTFRVAFLVLGLGFLVRDTYCVYLCNMCVCV